MFFFKKQQHWQVHNQAEVELQPTAEDYCSPSKFSQAQERAVPMNCKIHICTHRQSQTPRLGAKYRTPGNREGPVDA